MQNGFIFSVARTRRVNSLPLFTGKQKNVYCSFVANVNVTRLNLTNQSELRDENDLILTKGNQQQDPNYH